MNAYECLGSFNKKKGDCSICKYRDVCEKFVRKDEVIQFLEKLLQIVKEEKTK